MLQEVPSAKVPGFAKQVPPKHTPGGLQGPLPESHGCGPVAPIQFDNNGKVEAATLVVVVLEEVSKVDGGLKIVDVDEVDVEVEVVVVVLVVVVREVVEDVLV